jgi:hypothetical protein
MSDKIRVRTSGNGKGDRIRLAADEEHRRREHDRIFGPPAPPPQPTT